MLRVAELISGVRSDVGIKIYGDDLKLMKRTADEVARLIRQVSGAADVKAEQVIGLPTMRVCIDRDAIARYGINAEDVLEVIETIGGKEVGTVLEGQKRFALQVRFGDAVRDGLDQIGNLKIACPPMGSGAPRLIPLSQLASIEIEEGLHKSVERTSVGASPWKPACAVVTSRRSSPTHGNFWTPN